MKSVIAGSGMLVACCAVVGLAQGRFVPAQYREGALPQIPLQALGGGEVFLELSISGNGVVSGVRTLRATPPFTDALGQAVRGWRFVPAEEQIERKGVDSKVLVAGIFRPPTLNAPTLGVPPADVASPSDETPFPLATVTPAYPPLALESGIVLVEVLIDPVGDVVDAKPVRSSPAFDGPAIDAARRWRFRPARVHGVPVAALAYILFAFRQPVTVVPRKESTASADARDPFAFFRPSIVISVDDRQQREMIRQGVLRALHLFIDSADLPRSRPARGRRRHVPADRPQRAR